METILFYAAVACFALSLISYSLTVLIKSFPGLLTAGFYILGLIALLIKMIIAVFNSNISDPAVFLWVALVAFASMCLYAHLRLAGTMILPFSALLLVVIGLAGNHLKFLTGSLVTASFIRPSMTWGMTLASVGSGFAFAVILLYIISLSWRKLTGEDIHPSIRTVALAFPGVLRRLGWLAFIILTLSMVLYLSWSSSVMGILWFWQPIMACAACLWILFGGTHYLRIHL